MPHVCAHRAMRPLRLHTCTKDDDGWPEAFASPSHRRPASYHATRALRHRVPCTPRGAIAIPSRGASYCSQRLIMSAEGAPTIWKVIGAPSTIIAFKHAMTYRPLLLAHRNYKLQPNVTSMLKPAHLIIITLITARDCGSCRVLSRGDFLGNQSELSRVAGLIEGH